MAEFYPHKTYEEKLFDVLVTIPKSEWFDIGNRNDYDKITKIIKKFIDRGDPFEFSTDYKKVRRVTNFE